jgi:hypothetical protein
MPFSGKYKCTHVEPWVPGETLKTLPVLGFLSLPRREVAELAEKKVKENIPFLSNPNFDRSEIKSGREKIGVILRDDQTGQLWIDKKCPHNGCNYRIRDTVADEEFREWKIKGFVKLVG